VDTIDTSASPIVFERPSEAFSLVLQAEKPLTDAAAQELAMQMYDLMSLKVVHFPLTDTQVRSVSQVYLLTFPCSSTPTLCLRHQCLAFDITREIICKHTPLVEFLLTGCAGVEWKQACAIVPRDPEHC